MGKESLNSKPSSYFYYAAGLALLFFLRAAIPLETFSSLLIIVVLALTATLFNKNVQNKNMLYSIEHDELTDLLSKKCFNDEIKKMIDNGVDIAVLFIDLDGFKQVNDTLGHWAGDSLLIDVASRIKKSVRPFDKAFRLGGDELAVIITNINQENKISVCTQIAERIVSQVASPYHIDENSVTVTCSIGIAFSGIGISENALVSAADSAMYEAKNNGKNKFIFSKV